jgi:hypothetical protein
LCGECTVVGILRNVLIAVKESFALHLPRTKIRMAKQFTVLRTRLYALIMMVKMMMMTTMVSF